MSNSDDADDQTRGENNDREHDIEALRVTQQEVRTVLDHQIQTFNDVDDKAAQTSRMNGILIGLVLTAASFLAQSDNFDVSPYVNNYTILGIGFLLTSFILAILTFTTTDIETGPGPADIQRLIDRKYTEKEWLVLLLRSEANWMKDNERRHTVNGVLLTLSHAALIAGVIAISTGVLATQWPL